MIKMLKKIDGLFVTPVSSGADQQNEILCKELPFKVLKYKSMSEHNGWYVPYKWEVIKAEIKKGGKLIYDGQKHPLGVIGNSRSFKGSVNLTELKKHLYYFKSRPDEIIYHCHQYCRPHRKLWGFSLPYNLYKKLIPGKYEVNLQTTHTVGQMKALEYTHKGKSEKTMVFNAHNCHAAQLNDGPSGYAVLIELFKKLRKLKTRYTYKLIIAPEHLGTVFYLASLSQKEINNFKLGLFLEMVGNDNPIFALQESFNGNSLIDKIAHHILKHYSSGYWSDGYRKIVGNDESVWEAPGYEVPMISLSRCESRELPYPQYHLSSDNIKIIKNDKLKETLDIIWKMIDALEKDCYLKRKFTGLISLSNPKYDLYIMSGTDPSLKPLDDMERRAKWYHLMDCLPRYMNESISILDIAIKHGLPFAEVYNYLLKFQKKGLVEFVKRDLI